MINDRDVEEHIKKIALAAKRFKYYRPKDLAHFNVEETNNGICIGWKMENGQRGAFEMYYGPGGTYNKTELRAFGNGQHGNFISQTYAPHQTLDIDTCAELVYDAMKQLSTINNNTQILDLTYANQNYTHIRQ